MTDVQACLLILAFNVLLFIVNVGILGIMVKIYSEMIKHVEHERRDRGTRTPLPG